jgi:hypothetical protein
MLLSDVRLEFARDLIRHWLDIRRGTLVPVEDDIDPRALLNCLDYIGIVDLARPPNLTIEVAGAAASRRFGRDIRRVNWLDLVPPILGDAGQRARESISIVPCGFYHKFTIGVGQSALTGEALALPLRHRHASVPHAVMVMTRDVGNGIANAPGGWLTPSADVARYFHELVALVFDPYAG